MIRQFWDGQDFDLQLEDYEGNCNFCFKKSISKLVAIAREKPQLADWWKRVGNQYAAIGTGTNLEPRKMYRGYRKVEDILELASLPTLFDKFEFQEETDCFCKST